MRWADGLPVNIFMFTGSKCLKAQLSPFGGIKIQNGFLLFQGVQTYCMIK